MNKHEILDILQGAKSVKKIIVANEKTIQQLRDLTLKASPTISAVPGGSHEVQDKNAEYIAKIVDLERETEQENYEYLVRLGKAKSLINLLTDNNLKALLIKLYVNGESWTQICSDRTGSVRYSWSGGHKAEKRAIKDLVTLTRK